MPVRNANHSIYSYGNGNEKQEILFLEISRVMPVGGIKTTPGAPPDLCHAELLRAFAPMYLLPLNHFLRLNDNTDSY
ncbi:unnamed protein product [Spirodela intermedia]|uniref:Uncharacterized protein n=1 Tax=Spirodela intermedia TaxID=51605 RepID=A0A7I8LH72_SPIIN|nr:unnamed protein product [Spirodela intermedia]